ncbi:hypothetical protein L2E82_30060 [Cichorium intybus]|uniref:Uncharacterized protein n=1 Tax=Cichorium intybus TaxID=13427 RepID=A0ACB9CZC0_CICIN|nr:hypothetical protein L2E82_30060 [Cichorium intybus]
MYHPGALPAPVQNDVNAPGEVESIMKEDSADIDLLMSFEEEEDEEEEEEVSTARTHKNDEIDTADSCSLRLPGKGSGSVGRGSWLGLSTASCKSSGSSDRKRREMKKMVDSLRGIVPGSKRMNTVDVLDEAVKYLKSLKVEIQKVGVASLKDLKN